MRDTELLRAAGKADEGWFTTPGMIDGVKRVVSFRKVDGYPLVLAIGRSQNDVFRQHWYRRDTSRALACALTLFILIVIWVNIRHRKGLEIARAERRTSEMIAQEKSRELELTLEHMSQGIVMVGADHRIAFANGRAVELLDLPEFVHSRPRFEDLMAFHLARGEYGKDGNLVIPQVWQAIKAGDYYRQGSYERTRPNGVTLEVRTSPLPDGGIVRTFTDISERKRNEQKIAHMAHHDALTGLANRVLLRSHIETALRRHRRQGEGAALLLIDLDHFKKVNDTLGHGAGDELLRCVAQRLQGCVRELDTVARLGGDEFAVLQVAIDTHVAIARLASRVVAALSAPYELDGRPARIGVSIGIACSVDCQDIAQMFHNADLALYRVKAEGRNGYRLFEPEMDEAAKARRQLEENLREAQVRGEFEIYYQPIIDLGSGRITTVEALLRWNHPKRGLLSPADFMPVAEEIGMMPAIDSWVLNAACSEAKQWPGDTAVAVNLSPAKFRRRTVVDVVRNTLASTGLPAKRLELEISEKTILQETDSSNAVLLALHGLGVSIALDDFGVGYSSLSDLRTFRFDKIKIDKLFVSEIEHRNDCAAIVAAVAGLGRSLGAQTTAEGVETETQARLVRAAGCTQVQGYLYSRPVTASAIRSMLAIQATDRQAVA
jgi:diguanylate cyclase (GGDEF)-like protein